MKTKTRQSGLSLVEEVVVVAAIALLVVISIPAVRALIKSIESDSGAKAMISAALSTARAVAAREQHYAGIRFQQAYNRDALNPLDPLTAPQYMIFIVQDPEILAYGFKAVEGMQPLKLPDSVGVMDLRIRTNHGSSLNDAKVSSDEPIDIDSKIDGSEELRDTTAFSIIFSPSGKLVMHDVRVRNRNGEGDTSPIKSYDDVFNKRAEVNTKVGMFYQDDYADLGLGKEPSRKSFIIYERDKFEETYKKGRAWSDYLKDVASQEIHINPYTGTIIEK